VTISSSSSSATVTFSSAMPSTSYSAHATFDSSSSLNWGSSSSSVPLIYVSGKSTTGFSITIRNMGGSTLTPPSTVTIDWVVLLNN
jgi:hypothetical protein